MALVYASQTAPLNSDALHPSVLVIDDEFALATMMLDVLESAAIPADHCMPGESVLACIATKHPKVLLLDVQMPPPNGIEIFQHLQASPDLANIKVIFVTANADWLARWLPDYEQRDVLVLPKPFAINALLHVVRQALASAN
jgi:CheY-like chemotaxis protein